MRQLLRYGADPRCLDAQGQPVIFAMLEGQFSSRIFEFQAILMILLQRGADLNQPDGQDCRAVHLAAQKGLAENLQQLIEMGASLHVKDKGKKTPLDYAEENEDKKICEILEKFRWRG